MKNKILWPAVIAVSALLAGIVAWTNVATPLRSIIVFIFLLVMPGLAFTRLFHFGDFLSELILAIAVSLAIGTILAEFMVFAHLWSPYSGLGALILLSLFGAFLQVVQRSRTVPEQGG